MSLGKRIRKRRQSLAFTQKNLAEALKVTSQHISAIEKGRRSPSLDSLVKLAKDLGVTTDYLLTGEQILINETIPAIKADGRLSLRSKKAIITLIEEFYTRNGDN